MADPDFEPPPSRAREHKLTTLAAFAPTPKSNPYKTISSASVQDSSALAKERAAVDLTVKIAEEIRRLDQLLLDVDASHVPNSLLHFHVKPQGLGGGRAMSMDVRGDIKKDIDDLMELLVEAMKAVPHQKTPHPQLLLKGLAKLEANIEKDDAAFRGKAQSILRAAERSSGVVPQRQMESLGNEAAELADKHLRLLAFHQTKKAMSATLNALGTMLQFNPKNGPQKFKHIFSGIQKVAVNRMRFAVNAYQKVGSPQNRRALEHRLEEAFVLGLPSDELAEGIKLLKP